MICNHPSACNTHKVAPAYNRHALKPCTGYKGKTLTLTAAKPDVQHRLHLKLATGHNPVIASHPPQTQFKHFPDISPSDTWLYSKAFPHQNSGSIFTPCLAHLSLKTNAGWVNFRLRPPFPPDKVFPCKNKSGFLLWKERLLESRFKCKRLN